MAKIKPQALLQQSKKKKGPSRISVTAVAVYSLIAVVMVYFLFATYRHWSQRFVRNLNCGFMLCYVDKMGISDSYIVCIFLPFTLSRLIQNTCIVQFITFLE